MPDRPVEIGVLEAVPYVTDMGTAGCIQGQGGIPAHPLGVIHRLDMPGRPVEVGVFQEDAAQVGDMRPALSIQSQGGKNTHGTRSINYPCMPEISIQVGIL